jgi:hypothetical protein
MTAGVPRPCIRCGAPSLDTRCADCYAEVYQPRDRGPCPHVVDTGFVVKQLRAA